MEITEKPDTEASENKKQHRSHRQYRYKLAVDGLKFKPFSLADPAPTGHQFLEGAGLDPEKGYSLFAILPSGDFEDIHLNEPYDLTSPGAEKLVAFETDREFKLMLAGDQLKWGKPAIKGSELYKLANVDDGKAVFLDNPGGTDRFIARNDVVDLTEPGTENFIVALKPSTQVQIIVNARPFLVDAGDITFEEIVALGFPDQGGTNVVFSMTYRKAASKPRAGELAIGGSIEVKEGTVFNVTRTVQS